MSKSDAFFNDENAATNFGVRDEDHEVTQFGVVDGAGGSRMDGAKLDRNAKLIELDRIMAKEQVRKNFDEEKLGELAHSLKTVGQSQPILVFWSESDSKYVIIAGERRFRAAHLAGFTELACKIHPVEPSEAEKVELAFVENSIRTDLNAIEEAESYKQLQELMGYSANQLAERIGKNQTTISRSLRLLTLPESIRLSVADGKIPISLAREIIKVKPESAQIEMADRYLAGELTTNQAQTETVKKSVKPKKGAAAKTNKKWSRGKVAVSVSYPRGVTQADIAEVFEQLAAQLRQDGRGKKNLDEASRVAA